MAGSVDGNAMKTKIFMWLRCRPYSVPCKHWRVNQEKAACIGGASDEKHFKPSPALFATR
jgi:hypothetical protein